MEQWENRSPIAANLLNPAFCGEIIRRTITAYNDNDEKLLFSYSLMPLVLPILLHKKTRDKMPMRSSTYFHHWVDENEPLFLNFADRVKELLPYSKEALMFLLSHRCASITDDGKIEIQNYRKRNLRGENTDEVQSIFKKAELLGKWLRLTGNEQTIYMFLKIRP
ncbi:three component ABC system middle component [Bacteroides sp.]|uniref:three component ABC system middle component n=1 Tax=Bacteroides sp. TaxID=29523 RepID=UPI0025910DF6|nr:three component ABC system middle component [Bacteroides sp.]